MAYGCEIVTSAEPQQVSPDKQQFVYRHGLASPQDVVRWSAMSGGVSSDLWRVEAPDRTFCVKAALPTLRVKADWHAPLDRSSVEVAWLKFASEQAPGAVPTVLADDPAAGVFAMNYFDPIEYPVWKSELMAHRINDGTAERVGDLVGRLAEASVQRHVREDLSQRFATDDNFRLLRIEPYFLTTARRRPEVADRLRSLAERTSSIRRGLVHGDVSPKNILVGQGGPVLIDAECAWWGDPAFDVAFCLNHLLLKALVVDTQQRPRTSRTAFGRGTQVVGGLPRAHYVGVAELTGRSRRRPPTRTPSCSGRRYVARRIPHRRSRPDFRPRSSGANAFDGRSTRHQ